MIFNQTLLENYSEHRLQIEAFESQMESLVVKNKQFHGFAISSGMANLYQKTYFNYDSKMLHPLNSVTKSITAWMTLIALDKSRVSKDNAVMDVCPRSDWHKLVGHNPYLSQLKVQHLLNMQAGFVWPEVEQFYSDNNPFQQFLKSEDSIGYLLQTPQPFTPGTAVAYNSALSHLLGYCIEGLTGQSLEEFTVNNLFHPLGITDYLWEKDNKHKAYGGHGLHLSFDDLTKIAQMLAGQGQFQNQTVLSEMVIAQLQRKEVTGFRGYSGYGNGMWHLDYTSIKDCMSVNWISAFGHRGQRLFWSPELKLVLSFVGDVKPEFGLQEKLISILFQNKKA